MSNLAMSFLNRTAITGEKTTEETAALHRNGIAEPLQNCSSATYKVALVYQDFGQEGGIEQFIVQTATRLLHQKVIQPIVICSQGGSLFLRLSQAGIKVYGVKSWSWMKHSFLRTFDKPGQKQIQQLLAQEKPDVVHVHIGLTENLLYKQWGFPVVYTFHGYGSLFSSSTIRPGLSSWLKRHVKEASKKAFQETAGSIDRLLWVSAAEQQRMIEEGYVPASRQGVVLHNGVDIETLRQAYHQANPAAIKAAFNLPVAADTPVVTFAGRLDDNKNPMAFMRLAEAVKMACQQNNSALPVFVLAGDGPLMPSLQKMAARLNHVVLLGHLDEIAPLLAITDLMVFTTIQEGFGLTMVEAMAMGIPCLSYATGGATEILNPVPFGKNLLIEVNDEAGLLERVTHFLGSKSGFSSTESGLQQETLRQALQHRAETFGIDRFLDNLTTVYQQITPLVSVIIAVYNAQETVLRAVYSVLSQSYPHLEVIVVDDGSTDMTLGLLNSVKDSRLKVFPQNNQGVAKARNFAFTHAAGAYIAFLDADDFWVARKLSTEVQIANEYAPPEKPGCLVYSGYFAVDDENNLFHMPPVVRHDGDLSRIVLEQEGIFLPSTTFMHRSVFETVGGFKPECHHEDFVFFVEACQRFPAYSTEQRMVIYRQSLSGRCRGILKDYDRALQAEMVNVQALQPILSPDDFTSLGIRQQRNLMFRFMMYGYTDHAKRLYSEIENQTVLPDLLGGKKGLLAKVTLTTGINVLQLSRVVIQSATRYLLKPLWKKKMSFYTRFLQ
jgi:glycosyltransferase involved in cell wall biosynthesis